MRGGDSDLVGKIEKETAMKEQIERAQITFPCFPCSGTGRTSDCQRGGICMNCAGRGWRTMSVLEKQVLPNAIAGVVMDYAKTVVGRAILRKTFKS